MNRVDLCYGQKEYEGRRMRKETLMACGLRIQRLQSLGSHFQITFLISFLIYLNKYITKIP